MDPQPATPLPAKPSRFPLILTLLALLFLLSSLYLAYQNMQLQKQIALLQSSLIIPISPTPNPTENWKTYTNNKMKFTLKYPRDLSLSDERYYDPQYQREKTSIFGLDFRNDKGQTAYTFAIFNFEGEIDDWISQNKNKSLPAENDITSQKKIQVSNLDVFQIDYKYGLIYLFSHNQKIYWLGIGFGNAQVATQILSTFKFIQ